MTESTKKRALIIEQVPVLTDELQETLRILSAEHGIDIYTTRQRLLGGGLAHFGSGPLEKVTAIAGQLEQCGVNTWIIRPSKPKFGPKRLRGLEVRDDRIVFSLHNEEVELYKQDRVVAILADITGAVVDKQLKRLMARNIYEGVIDNSKLDDSEMRRAIYMGQPVYDLYLIDEENRIKSILRALPAKFDPKGLGEKASMSSRGNMQALVELTENFCENFTLHTSYGLSQLPGCQLKRAADSSDWVNDNLNSVVRFGWLMTDLARQLQRHRKKAEAIDGPSVGTVTAATLLGRPELAASGVLDEMPGLGEVIDEIDAAVKEQPKKEEEGKVDQRLPQPPPGRDREFSWRAMLTFFVTAGICMTLVLITEGNRLPGLVMNYGVLTGLLPGLAAALLFFFGFNLFLLKRRIENTPTSKIRSMAMGMVEIHGRARRKFALVAPMTHTPCVYYRLRKYRREDRGSERGTWKLTSESDSGHVPFYIEDATGRVTVDPKKAKIRAGSKQEGFPGQGNILFGGGGSYDETEKWVEEVIHEGKLLYVLGDAARLKKERKSLRERKIEKMRELKLDRAAMQKYDTDGDGRIDADEWQAAGEDIEQQVLHERLAEEGVAARQEDAIVIGRSKHRSHPFVITEMKSEESLTRNYAIFSGLMLTGALIAGIFTLKLTLDYFGIL